MNHFFPLLDLPCPRRGSWLSFKRNKAMLVARTGSLSLSHRPCELSAALLAS